MSISSMTNAALARRPDYPPAGRPPSSQAEIAGAADGAGQPENPVTTALKVIVTYIPTEVLTLYVAVLAAIHNPERKELGPEWITFVCFLVATPVVVWLLFAAKVKSARKAIPWAPSQWPIWEMAAATIAYAAWAFALPDTPFRDWSWYSSALSGVIVLIVSAALGLLAPLFQQQLVPS